MTRPISVMSPKNQISLPSTQSEERIVIMGGAPLCGEVPISGSKNSSLPILAASLLASSGECVLHNVPRISDVDTMCAMLSALGAHVQREGTTVIVNTRDLSSHIAPDHLVRKMRASFYVAAPLLARLHQAEVPLPGGCVLGDRPVNYHIDAFRKMGAEITVEHGAMNATAPNWHGAEIYLEPKNTSVGATVNIMMAACLAKGQTTIENAAREPEVVNLADFLCKMGGRVFGAGTSTIVIDGVEALQGAEISIFNDRIEAGTYLSAAGLTGGDITVRGLKPTHLPVYLEKLERAGLEITSCADAGAEWIRARATKALQAVDITTAPFPGFATDLQPFFLAMMCRAQGRSVIEENLYDGRFNFVSELVRMGADITRKENVAIATGVEKLSGAIVEASDLRAGAALVLAGLGAEGRTEVAKVEYIDRGYVGIVEKFHALGAQIARQQFAIPDEDVSFDAPESLARIA